MDKEKVRELVEDIIDQASLLVVSNVFAASILDICEEILDELDAPDGEDVITKYNTPSQKPPRKRGLFLMSAKIISAYSSYSKS